MLKGCLEGLKAFALGEICEVILLGEVPSGWEVFGKYGVISHVGHVKRIFWGTCRCNKF